MNQRVKVSLALALGSLLGAIVGLRINHYFWPVGLIVGFLVGYLSYEYKEVASMVTIARRRATNWEPDRAWWKAYGRVLWKTWIAGTGILSGPIVVALGYVWFSRQQTASKLIETGVSLAAWLFVPTVLICMIALMSADETLDALEQNPFATVGSFYKTWFWDLPRLSYKGLTLLPTGITIMGKFLRQLFRLIHSELRLLCGVDAAIGAFVGLHYHSPLIGMGAGVIWGLLNYEIVSKRILKCIPLSRST